MHQGSQTHSLQNSLFRQEPVTYCRPEPTYCRPEPLCVVTDIPKRVYDPNRQRSLEHLQT